MKLVMPDIEFPCPVCADPIRVPLDAVDTAAHTITITADVTTALAIHDCAVTS